MRRTLLEVADEIRAIATTGLHYGDGEHDRERYQRLLGLAARVAATATDEPVERLEEIYRQSDHGYATPKLDVRLAIFRGDEILLVRERRDTGRHCRFVSGPGRAIRRYAARSCLPVSTDDRDLVRGQRRPSWSRCAHQ